MRRIASTLAILLSFQLGTAFSRAQPPAIAEPAGSAPAIDAPDALPPNPEVTPVETTPGEPVPLVPPARPAPARPLPADPFPAEPDPFSVVPRPGRDRPVLVPAGPGTIPVPRSSALPPSTTVPPGVPRDERIPPLLDALRDRIAAEEALSGIQLSGGTIVNDALAPRRELRLVATGGSVAGRVRFAKTLRTTIEQTPDWKGWLDGHGYAVLYGGPPTDAETLIALSPKPEETPHVVELMQLVQDRIELDPNLRGALVVSGTFRGREGIDGRLLEIVGRLRDAQQRQLLERHFVEAMAALPYWRNARHSVFVTFDGLRSAPFSEALGVRYYTMGLDAFWDGNLTVADAAFTRAIAEQPDSLIYRYWRVVVHLAACQPARAEEKLRPLMHVNIAGQHSNLIAREFERLQGPLRWQLAQLERHILLTLEP